MRPFGPLFVTGLAHSGKTELARLLDTDERVHVTRRAYWWTAHFGRYGDLTDTANLARCLDALVKDRSTGATLDVVTRAVRDLSRSRVPLTYGALFAYLTGWDRPGVDVIQLQGVDRIAGEVLTDLPGARVVHMVRDPRRMLGLSRRAGRLGRRGWDLGGWALSAHSAIVNQERFPGRYTIVRWEDFAADTARFLGRLTDLVGFDVSVASQRADVSEDLKANPPPAAFIGALEQLVQDELESLGYELEGQPRRTSWRGPADRMAFHLRRRLGRTR